jgi:hypothetical protein
MNIHWKNGFTGSFATATNWVGDIDPGPNDVAELTTSGTITVSSPATVLALNLGTQASLIVNSSALTDTEGTAAGANRGTITVENGGQVNLGGTVDNVGTINLSNGTLNVQSFDATLVGGGTVAGLSTNPNIIDTIHVAAPFTLTNIDDTISGDADIEGKGELINQKSGVIDGNTVGSLIIALATTNSGLIEVDHGFLTIVEATINNVGGTIEATSGGQLTLNTANILGGTLTTNSDGVLNVFDSTLDGTGGHVVNNAGTMNVEEASTLKGIINNTGSIQIDAASLTIAGATTLEGGGSVALEVDSGVLEGDSGAVLTNVNNVIEGNTVAGTGKIFGTDWVLVNEAKGTIEATDSDGSAIGLILDLSGPTAFVSNAGMILANLASTLTIEGNIRNTSTGVIDAVGGSTISLEEGGTIVGGQISADLSDFDVPEGNAFTLDGSSAVVPTNTMITIAGRVNVEGALDLQGVINNTSTILIASPDGDGLLVIQPVGTHTTVTLEGKGLVILANIGANSIPDAIQGDGSAATLVNVNNTIEGGGTIGGGGLKFDNDAGGVIDASGNVPLTIDTGTNTVTNAGSMMAESGSALFIGSNLSNTGVLNANGGTITVEGTEAGGSAVVRGVGEVEYEGAASAGTTFAAGSTGELILDDAAQYTGTVVGFGKNTSQSIDLPNVQFATLSKSYLPASPNASGTLTVKDTAGDIAHIKLSGTYTLSNFTFVDDGNGGTLITDPPVDQKAHTIASGATLTLTTAATGTDTFAGKSGILVLDDPTGFSGKISGFSGQDLIDLADIGFGSNTTLGYAANGSDSGKLTVSDGIHTASIALLGNYMASTFAMASDGHGGTLITDVPHNQQGLLTTPLT